MSQPKSAQTQSRWIRSQWNAYAGGSFNVQDPFYIDDSISRTFSLRAWAGNCPFPKSAGRLAKTGLHISTYAWGPRLSVRCTTVLITVFSHIRFLLAVFALTYAIMLFSVAALAFPEEWRQEGWTKTDFTRHTVPWKEIISGGPPKDGIPAIDSPKFIPAGRITDIGDTEAVIALEINGVARAYPLRVLIWHEIANDKIADVPVAVTYCPLCNAAIVFDRRIDGKTLTFGTTGKLRNSDLIMYDRQTESWWQQFTGAAIVGQLTGQTLKILPARLESFALFKQRNPKGQVLIPNNKTFRAYGRNPYVNYDTSATPFLFTGELPEGIDPMARVVVVHLGRERIAIELTLLRQNGPINIKDLEISWRRGQASALDAHTVGGGRDVGNVIVRRKILHEKYEDVPYDVTFAFVYHAFHPQNAILRSCPPERAGHLEDRDIKVASDQGIKCMDGKFR